MWEASYGREAFDLRLTVIRMVRQWKGIVFAVFIGTFLFGAGYCMISYLSGNENLYRAKSTYRVDYGVEDVDVGLVVINATTWDTYVHTEEFVNQVHSHLPQNIQQQVSTDDIKSMITGNLESDWRVPATSVSYTDKELCEIVAEAVECAMVEDFPKGISEIHAIRVIDSAKEAQEVVPDVRPVRAVVLGFSLSLFTVLVYLLLYESGSDAIWLPSTLKYRYGLKVLGTVNSMELGENFQYLLGDKPMIALCPVQTEMNPKEVVSALKENTKSVADFLIVPTPLLSPECAEKLREASAVVLVVQAGKHAGKQTEFVLNYLTNQDCKVTAALLWSADESLIRWYYGLGNRKG